MFLFSSFYGLRRKEKKHSLNPSISPFSFFLVSLFSFFGPTFFSGVGKEVRREWQIVREDAGVREGDRQLL
jgi:hypothetical protein